MGLSEAISLARFDVDAIDGREHAHEEGLDDVSVLLAYL